MLDKFVSLKKYRYTDKGTVAKLKKIGIVILITLVIAMIQQSLLKIRIYLPGLSFLPQTLSYQFQDQLQKISSSFDISLLVFYMVGWSLNIPLAIFAYYKINKRYAVWTLISITCLTLWGIFFSLKFVGDLSIFKNLETRFQAGHRTEKVEFYLIALVAGAILGILISLLWKNDVNSGGLDVIYTYIVIHKRRSLNGVIVFINLIIVTFNILVNEIFIEETTNPEYIFFFIANSAIYSYLFSFMLNYLYPKFQIVTILIISKELNAIEKKLLAYWKRTATIVKASGLYRRKDNNIILITATFIEKNAVVALVKQVDKNTFITVLPTTETHGNFHFKLK